MKKFMMLLILITVLLIPFIAISESSIEEQKVICPGTANVYIKQMNCNGELLKYICASEYKILNGGGIRYKKYDSLHTDRYVYGCMLEVYPSHLQ